MRLAELVPHVERHATGNPCFMRTSVSDECRQPLDSNGGGEKIIAQPPSQFSMYLQPPATTDLQAAYMSRPFPTRHEFGHYELELRLPSRSKELWGAVKRMHQSISTIRT